MKELCNRAKEYKIPFIAGIIIAFLAHMFMFTNKLVNHDDIFYLFEKGATSSSGRWGLDLISYIFPDYSMPWLYGVLSVVLIIISGCIVCEIFNIKNTVFQILITAIFVTHPSLTSTFTYMYTSTSYAVAVLFSVLTVYLFLTDKKLNKAISVLLFVFVLSIYQAYISIIATLFLLHIINGLIKEDKKPTEIFKEVVSCLGMTVVALALYAAVTFAVFKIFDISFNDYAIKSLSNDLTFLKRIKIIYKEFIKIIVRGYYGIIPYRFMRIVHLIVSVIAFVKLFFIWLKKNLFGKICLLVFILLLPVALNCLYFITSLNAIHTVVLYGYCCIYVLYIIVADGENKTVVKNFVTAVLCAVVISNIYVANESYLRMHMNYENTYSFYTSVVTSIKNTEGFDEDTKLALIGDSANLQYKFEEFENIKNVKGTKEITNAYSKYEFIQKFIGFDMPKATEEEINAVMQTEEYKNMSVYPYYNSIRRIGSIIVVKFSDNN